jgi:hypothetical protein
MASVLGIIPPHPVPNARKTLPCIELGERLCHTFEIFRRVLPESHLSMDQFILLSLSLAEGDELQIGHCTHCHAALLLDRLSAGSRLCPSCKKASVKPIVLNVANEPSTVVEQNEHTGMQDEAHVAFQQTLFES